MFHNNFHSSSTASTSELSRSLSELVVLSTPSTTASKQQKEVSPLASTPLKVGDSATGAQSNSSILFAVTSKYLEKTPSIVKSEARNLIKRLENSVDEAMDALEQLYNLSMFHSHRQSMVQECGIISTLTLVLKTKENRFKELAARALQLYAQDGEESCIAMKRLNMCNSALEIITKTDDLNVKIPVVGLVYWLCQNPSCKKEFTDLGADTFLREVANKNKDPLLSKYLNYVLHSLSFKVKSREELLNEILVQQQEQQSLMSSSSGGGNNLKDDKALLNNSSSSATPIIMTEKSFTPYVTPSPRHFFNLARANPTSTTSPSRKRLEFSTPTKSEKSSSSNSSSFSQTELKPELVYESSTTDTEESSPTDP
ncbi:hypothetical protein FDP41_012728 [Naegleria fowleri]|uniref:Uncharacterized protein n=1 Tax=Naegleria fowleri TaxID=5763 RepID=A0A6A5C505_NAEFO|nr:uncharacterized protein FDP41_012728 [Naegleria fowleri]KAF0980940.1 hypothetical protein FDP41_012728 [Naegleria fowleri]CAG4714774.1 unnamed protein product [Naegleria fowleri]